MSSSSERQKKFREALRAEGFKRFEIWLPQEPYFLNKLNLLRSEVKIRNLGEIEEIQDALSEYDSEIEFIDPSESILY